MSRPEDVLIAKGYTDIDTPCNPVPDSMPFFQRAVVVGDMCYASGHPSGSTPGSVPSQCSIEDAKKGAEAATANLLRSVRDEIGSLDRIQRVVKVSGFVNADPDFTQVSLVVHGASELLYAVFGEAGRHARAALGMSTLPGGAAVEIEVIFQLKS